MKTVKDKKFHLYLKWLLVTSAIFFRVITVNRDHYEKNHRLYLGVSEITLVMVALLDGCLAYLGVQLLGGVDRVAFLLGEDLCHGNRQGVADHRDEEGVQKHAWGQLEEGHGRLGEPGEAGRKLGRCLSLSRSLFDAA